MAADLPDNEFADVAALSDLPEGAQRVVLVRGAPILVCHEPRSARIWAVLNRCPHAFQPLAGGLVRDGQIQCPKHGACFDLSTGRPSNAITARPAKVHAVQVVADRILVSCEPISKSFL